MKEGVNERMARVFSGCDSQMKHEEHNHTEKVWRGEEREWGGCCITVDELTVWERKTNVETQ